jgi:hypothetical protein
LPTLFSYHPSTLYPLFHNLLLTHFPSSL